MIVLRATGRGRRSEDVSYDSAVGVRVERMRRRNAWRPYFVRLWAGPVGGARARPLTPWEAPSPRPGQVLCVDAPGGERVWAGRVGITNPAGLLAVRARARVH